MQGLGYIINGTPVNNRSGDTMRARQKIQNAPSSDPACQVAVRPFSKKKTGALSSQKPQGPIPRQRFTGKDGGRTERCRAVGGTHWQLRANGELTDPAQEKWENKSSVLRSDTRLQAPMSGGNYIHNPPGMIYMVTSPVVLLLLSHYLVGK